MSVTLSEVKRAARAHRAPLAGESAGYLVLAIADQVLQAPRLVLPADVQPTEEGALRVMSGRASSDDDAELSLRRALDQLLLVASSGSAALTRASRRTAPTGLASLVRELEAALIPVNRAAARRALSRLHRETLRALQSGNLPEEEISAVSASEPAATAAVEPPAEPANAAPAPAIIAPPAEPAIAAPPVELVMNVEPAIVAPPVAPLGVEPAMFLRPVMPAIAVPMTLSPPALPVFEPAPSPAAPLSVAPREPNPEIEPELDLEQDLETPARMVPVMAAPPVEASVIFESHLDGVVSALCDELPAPPQFVESDALTWALAVQPVTAPPPVAEAEPESVGTEPEFLLDVDVEFEPEATDAVDSSAAPTVMRAVEVEPVTIMNSEVSSEPPLLELPPEARTRPEPVMLRKTLRPLLDLLPKPISDCEPLPETPTLGSLATQLPILAPEQIAEMSVAASALSYAAPAETAQQEDFTELMPEVAPLSPAVSIVESKKSDVNELLSSFQVAVPDVNAGLCRAIKEMAELDLTPAPFAALIR